MSPERDGAPRTTAPVAGLRFDAVAASDGGAVRVEGLAFDAAAGEVVAVLGGEPSGARLVPRLAAGLLRPDAGTVHALGSDLGSLPRQELLAIRARIAFVEDEPLFLNNVPMSANLHLPLRYHTTKPEAEIVAIVRERLRDCGVDEWGWKDGLPATLDRAFRKKASIARALSLDPEILLLDRPEWALPGHHHGFLIPLLKQIHERRRSLVLFSTESIRLAAGAATRILLIAAGRVAFDGDAATLRARAGGLGEAYATLAAHDPYGSSEETVP
jgi:ABC-type transporter Mla maintaining outer membrane lipid asymmetry ATPase subunit MlaF